jgi:flagellar biosynthesis/type III secretory pathway protein FliH
MNPSHVVLECPGSFPLREVTLSMTESHWDSIKAHFKGQQERDFECNRRDLELEIRGQVEREHHESAMQIRDMIQSFQEAIPNAFLEMEQALSHMALTLTRKLVADIPLDAVRVRAVIAQALKELEKDVDTQIQLHPEDLALLGDALGENPAATFEHQAKIQFITDTSITRGGCYVKTPFGDFDSTVESKWEQIEALIEQQMKQTAQLKQETSERILPTNLPGKTDT